MKVRITYFEARTGTEDVEGDYEVELNKGEKIISIEQVTRDGGYNSNWYRVYVQLPA